MTSTTWLKVTATLIGIAGFSGCSEFEPVVKQDPGHTFGEILVSAPRISSRQRLVEDRIKQDLWLQQQLEKTDSITNFGIQGKTDIRSAVALYAGVTADIDPMAAKLNEAVTQSQINQAQRADQIADLKSQIEIDRLKALEEQAKSQTDPSKITSPYSDSTGTTPTAGNATRPDIDITKSSDALSKAHTNLDQSASKELKKDAPADTSAQQSPLDDFRDRLAYREEIRNEIIQNSLDDRHDIGGNSLYRLNLDATVLAANDTSAWAVIGVCIRRDKNDQRCGNLDKESSLFSARDLAKKEEINAKFRVEDEHALKSQLELRWLNELSERLGEIDRINEHPDNKEWLGLLKTTRRLVAATNAAITEISVTDQTEDPKGETESSPNESNVEEENLSESAEAINNLKEILKKSNASREIRFSSVLSRKIRVINPQGPQSLVGLGGVDLDAPPKVSRDDICQKLGLPEVGKRYFTLSRRNTKAVLEAPIIFTACNGPSDEKLIFKALLQLGVAQYYVNLLDTWVEKSYQLNGGTPRENLITVRSADIDFPNLFFSQILKGSRDNIELYAYAGTPKESVQRISDVATRAQAQEFALALRALAGAANVSTLIGYAKRNDGLFQALQRQPLVVGFGHSSALTNNYIKQSNLNDVVSAADFGWILGPRFTISNDGKRSHFRQTVAQQGLSAVISVPSWWESAELVVTRQWISEQSGLPINDAIWKRTSMNFPIRLPATPSGILALLRPSSEIEPEELRTDMAAWSVTLGKEANLVIRGRDLWRNPSVMLGGQMASPVQIMPDMNGLIASFKPVVGIDGGPPSSSNGNMQGQSIPVSVATSEGWKTIGYAKIFDPNTPKNTAQQVAQNPSVAVGKERNLIVLRNPIQGYYKLYTSYRKVNSGSEFSDPVENIVWEDADKLNYLATYTRNAPKDADSIELRLLVEPAKGKERLVIPITSPVVYYSSAKSARIQAGHKGQQYVKTAGAYSMEIGLNFPRGFLKAYGVTNSVVAFDVADKEGAQIESTACTIKDNKCSIIVSWKEALSKMPEIHLTMHGIPDGWFDPSPAPICLSGSCGGTSKIRK